MTQANPTRPPSANRVVIPPSVGKQHCHPALRRPALRRPPSDHACSAAAPRQGILPARRRLRLPGAATRRICTGATAAVVEYTFQLSPARIQLQCLIVSGRDSIHPLTPTHSHSLALTTTHSHSLPLTSTHYHSLSLTPTHSFSLPLTPTHSHSLPLTPTHSHSLPLTPTHSH